MSAMNATFPDRETIHTVLSLATQAPSIHNSQPWRWRVGAQSLHLYAEPKRHLLIADPDCRDLLLSCGASLHHAVVALAAHGWQAKVHRLPTRRNRTTWRRLRFTRTRRVSRRDVGDGDPQATYRPPALQRVVRIGRGHRPDGRAGSARGRDVAASRAASEAATHCGPSCLAACKRSRLSHRIRPGADGTHRSPVFRPAAHRSPIPPRRSRAGCSPVPALAQPPDVSSDDDAAVVVALGTKDDSALARLRAGEATSLVLLTATALGLASCPVTEPLEIAETREAVKTDVFGVSGYPQMLLRLGWAPVNADPLPSTPRRPLSDVVEWLED